MKSVNSPARVLAAALGEADVEPRDGGHDFVVRLADCREVVLDGRWAGEGWPDDVRRVARDVGDRWPGDLVVLAERLSPGAIEWLRERGANWADAAGQARIVGPGGLLVIREPALGPRRPRSPRGFAWSPSALLVGELLLKSLDSRPILSSLVATDVGLSVSQAAAVLKAFDGQGWTVKRGAERGPRSRRELSDADGLLAAWTAGVEARPREARIAHRATDDMLALLREVLVPALARLEWALSGWAALELVAPFASATPSLQIYVADEDFTRSLTSAIDAAGLREVDEGGTVTFWRADARIFKLKEGDGIPIVSPARLYADLSSSGARGQDAADHVKAQLIDWRHPESGR
jgi:hypothetical protein